MEVDIEELGDVLVVEDNPGDIRLLEEAFEASPLDTTLHTARTREEALEMLFQRGEHDGVPTPDLVLVDWNLSQHTGDEVIRAVKSVDSAIPVVVMTGSRPGLQRIESESPAADGYIEKQTDIEAYIDILRSCGTER